MRSRDLLILTLVLAFAAGIGLVLMGDESHATGALVPPSEPEAVEAKAPPPVTIEATPATAEVDGAPLAAAYSTATERVDTAGWTSGIVRGDIQLAVSVLDQLDSMQVIVEELRSSFGTDEPPHRIMVPVQRGIGTPTFEVRDIPFSDHPYSVRIYSPGLNGSSRTVTIDAMTPLHDDIVLTITPGRPFSVLVRDQDRNPYPQVEVRLLPIGEPKGRREHIGTTDGYGSAVFESVLSGDYRLVAGQKGMQLCEPELITVQQGTRFYGNKIQGQGYTLEIRRGVPLQLTAVCAGYGVADATVKILATDRIQVKALDAVTDFAGKVEFPHVTPGTWMITVTKPNYSTWTTQVTITDGQLPEIVQADLRRLR